MTRLQFLAPIYSDWTAKSLGKSVDMAGGPSAAYPPAVVTGMPGAATHVLLVAARHGRRGG